MRALRLLAPSGPGEGFPVLYHITSRVVEKRFIFDERERARFLKLAKDFAAFSGFELVSWCLMSNHFHLLVRVPVQDVEAISDEEMVERLRHILSAKRLQNVVALLKASPTAEMRRDVLDGFRRRVGHLPSYVKAVKQEFTQWFNAVNKRVGTLWEGRYHSTLIEDTGADHAEEEGVGEVARIVAAYIDMNAARARVVADPADNNWSSFGAATRGDRVAVRGLELLWGRKLLAERVRAGDPSDGNSRPSFPIVVEIHRAWLERDRRRWLREDESMQAAADEGGLREGSNEADGGASAGSDGARRRSLPRLLGGRGFLARFGVSGEPSFGS